MEERVANFVFRVKALETFTVIAKNEIDSLMKQVHGAQGRCREAARNSAEFHKSL